MPYVDAFSVFVRVMEWAVALFAVAVVAFTAMIVVLHLRNSARLKRHSRLESRWKEAFGSAFTTPTATLPDIAKGDSYAVALIFNGVRELRQGDREGETDYAGRLNAMARALGLDTFALQLLEKGDDADKIVALTTLGQLADRRAFKSALALLNAPNGELSRAAGHCLLRLDPSQVDRVLIEVRDRGDWARPRVEQMLRELDNAGLDAAVERAIAVSDDRGKSGLLGIVRCCSIEANRRICRDVLRTPGNPEVVAAALRALGPVAQAEDEPLARGYVAHSLAFVRLAAVRVLITSATTGDQDIFEKLLADRDFWVRLRAAEGLVAVNQGNSSALEATQRHADPFARAAVTAALAEFKAGVNSSGRISNRRGNQSGPGARQQ